MGLNCVAGQLSTYVFHHLRQERIALGWLVVLLEPFALIGCHRQGLLFHLDLPVVNPRGAVHLGCAAMERHC